MRLQRDDRLAIGRGGALRHPHHARLRGAIDIGIQQADPPPLPRQRHREVRRHGGFAHPALAGADGDDAVHPRRSAAARPAAASGAGRSSGWAARPWPPGHAPSSPPAPTSPRAARAGPPRPAACTGARRAGLIGVGRLDDKADRWPPSIVSARIKSCDSRVPPPGRVIFNKVCRTVSRVIGMGRSLTVTGARVFRCLSCSKLVTFAAKGKAGFTECSNFRRSVCLLLGKSTFLPCGCCMAALQAMAIVHMQQLPHVTPNGATKTAMGQKTVSAKRRTEAKDDVCKHDPRWAPQLG